MTTFLLRYLFSFVLVAIVSCSNGTTNVTNETLNEKTTEIVGKVVIDAEQKGGTQQNKEAAAVAEATIGVLKAESAVTNDVNEKVIDKASDEAIATYKELKNATVGSKAAADAAAKVAIAEVDGAARHDVDKVVKENAEKAAVAVGSALADRPGSDNEAISNAVAKVKEEEKTPGPVDVNEKGVISKAEDAVSELPVAAAQEVKSRPYFLFLAFIPFGYFFYRYKKENQPSEYMQKILLIRKEIDVEEGQEMKGPAYEHYAPFGGQ